MPEKIRIGFITGKAHDPILVGQQDRAWPEKFKMKNNLTSNPNAAGWGGQFHIDVAVPLRLARLHPDLFEMDIMSPDDVSLSRLQKNHINFNMGHDYIDSHAFGNKKHAARVQRALMPSSNNLYPEWPVQNWIYRKDVYIKALDRAGIPIIPTIVVYDKFDAKKILKQVQAKGWDKFFIKPGDFGTYSRGIWNGTTQDEINNNMESLIKYQKEEAPDFKIFLVQPYMVKPNGNVFDEIRNFFVDGEWKYAVYTDGTDDNAVYTQPPGRVLAVVKELAQRAYERWLKVVKWRGKSFVPIVTRVDIGIIPDKKCPGGVRTFVNEIEQECCTFLVRYCPFNLLNLLGEVYTRKVFELLSGRLQSGEKVKDAARIKNVLAELEGRLANQSAKPGSVRMKRKAEQAFGFSSATLDATPAKKTRA